VATSEGGRANGGGGENIRKGVVLQDRSKRQQGSVGVPGRTKAGGGDEEVDTSPLEWGECFNAG